MELLALLILLLLVIFFVFIGRNSASVQRNRESPRETLPDANSEHSFLSIVPHQDQPHTASVAEPISRNAVVHDYRIDSVVDSSVNVSSIDYVSSTESTGGELGGALADAMDTGGNSFGSFDSGGDFGGGSTSDGSS